MTRDNQAFTSDVDEDPSCLLRVQADFGANLDPVQ